MGDKRNEKLALVFFGVFLFCFFLGNQTGVQCKFKQFAVRLAVAVLGCQKRFLFRKKTQVTSFIFFNAKFILESYYLENNIFTAYSVLIHISVNTSPLKVVSDLDLSLWSGNEEGQEVPAYKLGLKWMILLNISTNITTLSSWQYLHFLELPY